MPNVSEIHRHLYYPESSAVLTTLLLELHRNGGATACQISTLKRHDGQETLKKSLDTNFTFLKVRAAAGKSLRQMIANAIAKKSGQCIFLVCASARECLPTTADDILHDKQYTDISSLCFLGVPPIESNDANLVSSLSYVEHYSRSRPSVVWKPYDNIKRFLAYSWPNFTSNQTSAITTLSAFTQSLNYTTVVDIGCGDGTILKGLINNKPVDVVHAVDPSKRQIEDAQFNLPNATCHCEFLDQLQMADESWGSLGDGLALILGNTITHIGSFHVGRWLTMCEKLKRKPKYILYDVASNWDSLTRQGDWESGTSIIHIHNFENSMSEIRAFMQTTMSGMDSIKRGVTMQLYCTGTDGQKHFLYDTSVFSKLSSDTAERYEAMFKAQGYSVEAKGEYTSGWGRQRLFLATINTSVTDHRWPIPSSCDSQVVNSLWAAALSELFTSLDVDGSEAFPSIKFAGCAILPFDCQTVYAKYLPTREHHSHDILEAWMFLVSREELLMTGRPTAAEGLPLAPALHRIMLASVQGSFVRQTDTPHADVEVPDAVWNNWDKTLAILEREFLGTPTKLGYFCIPLYVEGFPTAVLYARFVPTSLPPESVMLLLRHEKERLEATFREKMNESFWKAFFRECVKAKVSKVFLEGMWSKAFPPLNEVDSAVGRSWKSWLESLPGASVHAEFVSDGRELPKGRRNTVHNPKFKPWREFLVEKERLMQEVLAEHYHEISLMLERECFFTSRRTDRDNGCGHEHLTKRHRDKLHKIQENVNQIYKDASPGLRDICKFTNVSLNAFVAAQAELPDDDLNELKIDRLDEDHRNLQVQFQKFKSVFCRAGANTLPEYRISLLGFLTGSTIFAPDLAEANIRINGKSVFWKNVIASVKPKLGPPDARPHYLWEVNNTMWRFVQSGAITNKIREVDFASTEQEVNISVSYLQALPGETVSGDSFGLGLALLAKIFSCSPYPRRGATGFSVKLSAQCSKNNTGELTWRSEL